MNGGEGARVLDMAGGGLYISVKDRSMQVPEGESARRKEREVVISNSDSLGTLGTHRIIYSVISRQLKVGDF